jgi:hypothetical protein
MNTIQGNVTGPEKKPAKTPGIPKACYSVNEFCLAHAISRAMFYKLRLEGKGPKTMSVGSRTLISSEAAADWRRACEGEVAG